MGDFMRFCRVREKSVLQFATVVASVCSRRRSEGGGGEKKGERFGVSWGWDRW